MTMRSLSAIDPPAERPGPWLWAGPLLFVAAIACYFILRYNGTWAEADSATFTILTRPFIDEGRLVPKGGVYTNGFAFQAISAFIVGLTGIDLATLQQLVYPLAGTLVVLPAVAAYRALTSSMRAATVATILLFAQPEFLFVILRSSHEKFTRALMLLCLFLLARSFVLRDRPRVFAAHVALFYLAAFGFIASNSLLAHSFLVAVGVSLLLGWALDRRNPPGMRKGPTIRRLLYVILIGLGLTYLFMFDLYPPARHHLSVFNDTLERIQQLFLDVQESPETTSLTDAYRYVSFGWISLPVYFAVSIANWIILAISLALWLRQGWLWLVHRQPHTTSTAWLLWLLYAGFALQGALSAVVDASGALGSNLQHRLFPSFAIVAVAMIASAIAGWRPGRLRWQLLAAMTAAMFCVAILSVLKATNEPLLSNKWTFYSPAEMAALTWANDRLSNAKIWTEYDERIATGFATAHRGPTNGNSVRAYALDPAVRTIILSDITRLRADRLQLPLPTPPDALQVYDNGEAEVYRLRPQTPFQR